MNKTEHIEIRRAKRFAGLPALNAVACGVALLASGTTADAQSIVANFAGLNLAQTAAANGFKYAPPDSNGAIGKDYFVEFINGGYSVFNRTGVQQSFTTDSTFWLSAGASASLVNQGLSDTRVKYDPTSNRWFASEITLGNASTNLNNSVLLAVSKTSNPLDGWTSTSYNVAGSTSFNDYPTLNVDANAVYIGTNNFGSSGGFTGVTLSSIPKSSLLGLGPTTTGIATFTQNSGSPSLGFTPQAVTNYGTGYTGTSIVSISASAFNEVNITKVNNTATAGATLGPTKITTIAFDGNPTLVRQPNGSRVVDGLDDRFSGTIYQVGNLIYAANAINVNNGGSTGLEPGFNKVHWLVLDANTGAVVQEGLVGDATHDYWQPSISANAKGDVVIGFNKSGADLNISSVAAVGHTVNGILSFNDEVILKTSAVGNYTDGFKASTSRWGDYSATMVDPDDENVFWTIQEIAFDSTTWGTQISAINVAAVPEPETYALMLAGLGVVGWAARRRRVVGARAAD